MYTVFVFWKKNIQFKKVITYLTQFATKTLTKITNLQEIGL